MKTLEKTEKQFWALVKDLLGGPCQIVRAEQNNDPMLREESKPFAMVSIGDPIDLDYITLQDPPDRRCDGSFGGGGNLVWRITQEQKDEFLALNQERAKSESEKKKKQKIAWLKAKIDSVSMPEKLPSLKDAKQLADAYDGYMPHIVTKEEFQGWLGELKEIQ